MTSYICSKKCYWVKKCPYNGSSAPSRQKRRTVVNAMAWLEIFYLRLNIMISLEVFINFTIQGLLFLLLFPSLF